MTKRHLEILELIKNTKNKPGVYLWKNKTNKVIYIGKAKDIKKRLMQYLNGSLNSYKTPKMFEEIYNFDLYYTLNEKDALVLEEELIKKHKPKYNIKLVYSSKNKYIKIYIDKKNLIKFGFDSKISNKKVLENQFYFGPLIYDDEHRNFIDVLKSYFLYQDGLLITKQTIDEAKSVLNQIIEIFKFKNNDFNDELFRTEQKFSKLLDFENAHKYKKAQNFLKKLKEPQVAEIRNIHSIDYIAFKTFQDYVFIGIRNYTYGITTSFALKYYKFNGIITEFFENFLEVYYSQKLLPKKIIFSNEMRDFINEIEFSHKSLISFAKIGVNKLILNNLEHNLDEKYELIEKNVSIFNEISRMLKINEIKKIYIFDNSFWNDKKGIGTVLEVSESNINKPIVHKWNLEKELSHYQKANDLKYMYFNVLKFLKFFETKISPNDLFIADGGLLQINEIKEALKNYGKNNQVIGLVKDKTHLTSKIINDQNIVLNFSANVFNFFSFLQNKVDKEAKKYLSKRKDTKFLNSQLQQIKGIGEKTEIKLLKHFGTLDNIKSATDQELLKFISKRQLKNLKENQK
ncbi:GIY-YIG nuclease family protein [Mycoplasmopsis cynos]|uniref:GIY-YIG nuclease family protein n=1 Tax=Mycoplasmopsis cynos TaxID=171284 RepID=UPI0024CCEB8B|nr:GIY-YIG nuclease family protein [Mycoplasmopsis cynos]MCU9935499.1 GIY-YIG nuclease family protein [Mycoplasmopsis cynos]WAM05774.1 GIY-YIG nuclease family protein [Mycoplasmopsis cynos]